MALISLGAGVLIALVLIIGVSEATGGHVTTTTQPNSALDGTTLADLHEGGLYGGTVSAPWSVHQPTAIVFFASWCTACRSELPALATYLRTAHLGKVKVLGVDVNDLRSSGQAMAKKYSMDYPIMFDPSTSLAAGTFKISGLPDTVFVNAQGVVKSVHIGEISTSQFAAGVAALNA